jgi:hypothetical protein
VSTTDAPSSSSGGAGEADIYVGKGRVIRDNPAKYPGKVGGVGGRLRGDPRAVPKGHCSRSLPTDASAEQRSAQRAGRPCSRSACMMMGVTLQPRT